MMTPHLFAMEKVEIVLPTAPIFHIGPVPITNAMLLGGFSSAVMLGIFFYVAYMVKRGGRLSHGTIYTFSYIQ